MSHDRHTARRRTRARTAHRAAAALLAVATLVLARAPVDAQLPAPPVSSLDRFHVGAYGGVVFGHATRTGQGTETGISEANASLLVSGTVTPRLSYFGEVEAASTTRENWTGRDEGDVLGIERLYAEYTFHDALRLRGGVFLTPVGQWNEIHAEPLTWTAHRPLTTYRPFAKSMTGLMATGQLELFARDAGYSAYAAVPGAAVYEAEESEFLHALGGRLAIELAPGFFVGASGAALRASRPVGPDDEEHEFEERSEDGDEPGEVEDDEREDDASNRVLAGVDLSWRFRGAEILAEATYLSGAETAPAEAGAFAQLAIPLLPAAGLYVVGRGELYDPVVDSSLWIATLGLTLRPTRHLSIKLERQAPNRLSYRVGDGWYLSVSGIF